ncbi:flagellar hook-associated protein FlgK [Betaproteobacteria bacterium GR16-43]|nr:flagellar hook-associated protein FlgK [Betaproteobacteria bacterium GR16-43]
MPSLISIGASALNAASLGLSTTSHNIANVNTLGYTRQQTIQGTNTPQFSGAGYFGQGVHVETVRRQYDQFLTGQVRNTESSMSRLTSMLDPLKTIDSLLADPAAGLSPVVQDFFAAANQLAQHPSDPAARQGLLSQANALAARFHMMDGQVAHLRDDANGRIQSSADVINTLAQQIAEVNQRIREASGTQQQPPNDLLDHRDQLMLELNKQVNATTVANDDGSVNVFLGNGQPLVVGENVSKIVTQRDPSNPEKLTVGLQSGSLLVAFRAGDLTGGELAGTLDFRDTQLDGIQNSLGRMAVALARTFNDQHQVGQDLTGALGGAFFVEAAPRVLVDSRNTGTGVVGAVIANLSALGTSDYQLGFDGTNYTLRRLSDGVTQSFATLPQTVDGVTFSLSSGTPAAGDRFLIQPTRDGAANLNALITDPARVAAAAPVVSGSAAGNLGNAVASPPSVSIPANANLQQPVTITFTSPTTFNVTGVGTGNPTGLTYTPGQPITYNGWTLSVTGTPVAGDSLSVSPNIGGTGDNRNATALAAIQSLKSLDGGTNSVSGAYARLVSDVGNQGRSLTLTAEAQGKLADDAIGARESVAGVNLDEEAANLLRYQQAYQAAGKLLQVAGTLFDQLLDLGR